MRAVLACGVAALAAAVGWLLLPGATDGGTAAAGVADAVRPDPAREGGTPAVGPGAVSAPAEPGPASGATRAAAPDPTAGATFLVTDAAGRPMEDAELWTVTWERSLWAHGAGGRHPDPEAVRVRTTVRRTDAAGAAELDLAGLPVAPHGHVVWAVRPGFALEQRLFDALAAAATPLRFELEPAAAPAVEVVDALGVPAPDAHVELRLPVGPPLPFEGLSPAQHACSTFSGRFACDEAGRVTLPAPPRESVRDAVLARAVRGAETSGWVALAAGDHARLELGPAFEVAGRVEGFGRFVELGADLASVVIEVERDGAWAPVGQLAVASGGATVAASADGGASSRTDLGAAGSGPADAGPGRFGPGRFAYVDGARYRARLDALVGVPEPVRFTPVAGGRTELELVARTTGAAWVRVAPSEAAATGGLPGATASAIWDGEAGRVEAPGIAQGPGEPGVVQLPGVPEDRPFWIEARAPGRAPARIGPLRLTDVSSTPELVTLAPAAELAGEIELLEPTAVTLFLLPAGSASDLTRVRLAPEGERRTLAFALAAAPAGDLWAVARGDDGRWSRPLRVPATAREDVRLSLAGATRTVRVVDADSTAPVAGAALRLSLRNDAGRQVALGLVARSDAEGWLAHPLAVTRDPRHLLATLGRDGYRTRGDLRADGRGDGDSIALEPLEPRTVRLVHADGRVPTAIGIDVYGPTPTPFAPLAADATVDLAGRAPGAYAIRLAHSPDAYTWLWFSLPDGPADGEALAIDGPASLEVDLGARADDRLLVVEVRVSPDVGAGVSDPPSSGPGSAASDLPARVERGVQRVVQPDQRFLRIDSLPVGSARVRVEAADDYARLAEAHATLTPGGEPARVAFDLTPTGWSFEVVDGEGARVEGARLSVIDAVAGVVLGSGATDAEGRAAILCDRATEDATVGVSAPGRGARLGVALGPPTPLGPAAPVTRLELGAQARLAVQVVADGAPLPGADVQVSDLSERLVLAPGARTGNGGRLEFDDLPRGPVLVAARAAGYFPEWIAVELDGATTLDVALDPVGPLELVVVDGDGAPVAGAVASLTRSGTDEAPLGTWPGQGVASSPSGFTTGPDGRLELDGVPRTALELVVRAGEREARRRLPRDRAERVEVTLEPVAAAADPR